MSSSDSADDTANVTNVANIVVDEDENNDDNVGEEVVDVAVDEDNVGSIGDTDERKPAEDQVVNSHEDDRLASTSDVDVEPNGTDSEGSHSGGTEPGVSATARSGAGDTAAQEPPTVPPIADASAVASKVLASAAHQKTAEQSAADSSSHSQSSPSATPPPTSAASTALTPPAPTSSNRSSSSSTTSSSSSSSSSPSARRTAQQLLMPVPRSDHANGGAGLVVIGADGSAGVGAGEGSNGGLPGRVDEASEIRARAEAARVSRGAETVVEQPPLGPEFDVADDDDQAALDELAFDQEYESESGESVVDPLEYALYEPPPIMECRVQFTAGVAGYFDRSSPDDPVDEPPIDAVSFHPSYPWMLVGAGFYAELWDLVPKKKPDAGSSATADQEKPLLSFAWRLECDVRCVQFCPMISTNLFATGGKPYKSGKPGIEFWSVKERDRMFVLPITTTVRELQFHDQLPWLFCVADPHSVSVFNWQSRNQLFRVKSAHQEHISSIRLHPRLPLFCTASHDLTIKVWDYQLLRAKHGCPFIASAADGDGNALLAPPKRVGSNAVRVVSVLSTAACGKGHKAAVSYAIFHDQFPSADFPNQLCVFSGSRDGYMRVWTLGKERNGLRYSADASHSSLFTPGRTLYDAALVHCPGGVQPWCIVSHGSDLLMLSTTVIAPNSLVASVARESANNRRAKGKSGSSRDQQQQQQVSQKDRRGAAPSNATMHHSTDDSAAVAAEVEKPGAGTDDNGDPSNLPEEKAGGENDEIHNDANVTNNDDLLEASSAGQQDQELEASDSPLVAMASCLRAGEPVIRSLVVPGPLGPESGAMTSMSAHPTLPLFAVTAEDGTVSVLGPRPHLWPALAAQSDVSVDQKGRLWVAFLAPHATANHLRKAAVQFADDVASHTEAELGGPGASDGLFDVHDHEDFKDLLKSQFVVESDRASITFTVGFNQDNEKIVHAKFAQSQEPEEAEAFLWGYAVEIARQRLLRSSPILIQK